jgi:hypothetical protein
MYFFEGRGHIVLVAANKPTDTQRPPPRRRAERSHVLSETGSPSLKPPPCAAMNPRPPSPSPLPRSVSPLATFRWFWCRSAAGRGETRLATYSSATYCISVSRGQRRVARASGGRGRGSGEQSTAPPCERRTCFALWAPIDESEYTARTEPSDDSRGRRLVSRGPLWG